MDFSEALKLLKQGKIMRRACWSSHKSILLIHAYQTDLILPYIAISTKDNKVGVYTATTCDILADDWVLIREDKDN